MTSRKPPNMSFPDWVERQIRTAQAEGAFENLPGAGEPIPGIDRPQHELAWVANYLRRENTDVAALLPPALALAKEAELLPERLLRERSEFVVRERVEDLNDRIRRAYRQPQLGPPMRVRVVDVENAIEQWRSGRSAMTRVRDVEVADQPRPVPRRRWFRRRRA
jgi:Domain of unknown function (DUF1992)